jgi:hypothetical protein
MTASVPARRADDRRHVGPGADAAPVTVVLRPTAALTGRLATAAGEPRAEVRVAASLYAFQQERGGVTAAGYAGDPSLDRPGPSLQYLFVNGRWVRDRGVFQAVQEAYQGLVMAGRYPAAFVFLDLPAGEVDVNAHPAKAEVRFRDRGAVYALVREAVRARLDQADLTARAATARKVNPDAAARREAPQGATPAAPAAERRTGRAAPPAPGTGSVPRPRTGPPRRIEPPATAAPVPPAVAPGGLVPAAPAARAMQVLGCYLVVEVPPDEVLVVDQHALHERVLYERLIVQARPGREEADLPPLAHVLPRPGRLPPRRPARRHRRPALRRQPARARHSHHRPGRGRGGRQGRRVPAGDGDGRGPAVQAPQPPRFPGAVRLYPGVGREHGRTSGPGRPRTEGASRAAQQVAPARGNESRSAEVLRHGQPVRLPALAPRQRRVPRRGGG